MTETDALAREVPAEAPAAPPEAVTPKSEPDIDALLAEYNAAVPPEPKSEVAETGELDGELQQEAVAALRDMDAGAVPGHVDQRLAELQNRNAELEAHIHREQEAAAFKAFAADLQKQLPDYALPDHAETALMAAAAKNPELTFAWDNR